MSRTSRRTWQIFAACTVAVAAAMAWMTSMVLALERNEGRVRADNEQQAALRLALWRMDSWLLPKLAREASRPYFEYLPYYPQQNAFTSFLCAIQPGGVVAPSPLLTFRSELFPLHFQLSQAAGLTSPQVPMGNLLDHTQARMPALDLATSRAALERLRPLIDWAGIERRVTAAEAALPAEGCSDPKNFPGSAVNPKSSIWQNALEYENRAQNFNRAQQGDQTQDAQQKNAAAPQQDEVERGPLVPLWIEPGSLAPTLVFVRRARTPKETLLQGFLVEWPRLHTTLLDLVTNLFVGRAAPALQPSEHPSEEQKGWMMTTVPALLAASCEAPALALITPTRGVLATAWLVLMLAVFAVGFTLRSAIEYGERRARFASAVTHELRTPLTTFRMYSEMLAEDIVTEPGQRRVYLDTLKDESDRLSRLVENVLCYARLEDGRYRGRRERITVAALLDRVAPPLARRAAGAGMQLTITPADASVEVDPDAIAQILFNLVDNACKYAGAATDGGSGSRELVLDAQADAAGVRIALRDHGPGIPAEHRRRVFAPFDRGERAAGDNVTPGVGLGLALARGLARDQGGELTLDATVSDGARFVLQLPRA